MNRTELIEFLLQQFDKQFYNPDQMGDELIHFDEAKSFIANALREFDLSTIHNDSPQLQRLLVLATKWIPKDHHDWEEFISMGWEFDNKNICDTAPYPECNGANGCDTCEHQPED